MIQSIQMKFKLFCMRFREAWLACMICMVQGDLTVISVNHALTASKTGGIAGIAFVILSNFRNLHKNKWAVVWSISVLTMLADYMVHPTHFGPEMAEAVTTGLVSGLIAYFMMRYVDAK